MMNYLNNSNFSFERFFVFFVLESHLLTFCYTAVFYVISGHHRTISHRVFENFDYLYHVTSRSAVHEELVLVRYTVRRPRFDVQQVDIVTLTRKHDNISIKNR